MITDLLGFSALALMLLAVSKDDLNLFRKLALAATCLFMAQAIMLESVSLIISNTCFASLYTYKLIQNKLNKSLTSKA